MKKAMKGMTVLALLGCLLVGAVAMAQEYPNSIHFGVPEGPGGSAVMMIDLPEDTLMTERIVFEGGDYIQTFQLPCGGTVQILRYEQFDLSMMDLAEGEWYGYQAIEELNIEELDPCFEEGIHLKMETEACEVYILKAETENPRQVHLLQVVLPQTLGVEQLEKEIDRLLKSVLIQGVDALEFG